VKVATKLGGAFMLHFVLLGALLIYHVRTIRDVVSSGYEITEISSRVYSSATEQGVRIAQLEENAAKHAVTRDSGYLAKFQELSVAFSDELAQLQEQPLTPAERHELALLTAEWRDFTAIGARLESATNVSEGAADSLAVMQAHLDTLRAHTQRLGNASQAAMLAQLRRSAGTARRAERLSWIAAAGALILSALVSVLIVRSITDSLGRLAEGTREVARGRFGYRLAVDRTDEFADVARDFNTMTARLDELDRMKRDFVSKVSHDLKTPLASMQETIDALLDEVAGSISPRQRRLLELNYQSGERLSAMLGKLLDLSSLEAGAVEPRIERVDLRTLVRNVADTHSRPGAEVHVSMDGALQLHCDGDRVTQLLHNLVENAVKYASPGGVAISARASDAAPGAIHLVVSDDGPGIPDEDKKRVFERFYQAEAGRAARSRGVGLGLTICREIVHGHGGTIDVRDRQGGGSEFHVLLPDAAVARRHDADATDRAEAHVA
jgi:signal transduction histidine kinase